ncbi:Putative type-1 restriction enzyme MjaXP specificity protein [Marine Group I thaumarchaeote SCGC AAA799-N04]|uniref:Putative type-1 restriction enzyme MjaXP specificity protein n=1 Tax=Marine Group I thaumarchaeote SCGC AAA799-N04 TaxID=1502293 RepID=A0A081RMH0_9ARCH|nr:Putative type-1 restriction enzyme MjaXP specificity protein [Marine Group I thaumarchaeote SCGC AAA799-N04]
MVKWNEKSIEDACERIIDYRGKTPKKMPYGIPLITAKIIKDGKIDYSNLEYIAEGDYDSWMVRGIPQKDDVVITTEAPLGEIAQLDSRKIALAQRVITLRGKKNETDNNFLRYLLQTHEVKSRILAKATGSTADGIRQSELREVLLPMPEFEEQERIGKILRCFDDQIQKLESNNVNLKKINQSLFKSWFIEFDGQSEFVNSELGQIPLGWYVVSFENFARLIKGFSYKGSEKFEKINEFLFVTLNNIKEGGGFNTKRIPQASNGLSNWFTRSKALLDENNIIVTKYSNKQSKKVSGFNPNAILYTIKRVELIQTTLKNELDV